MENENPAKCQTCENKDNKPVKIYNPRTAGHPYKRVNLCDDCAANPTTYPGAVLDEVVSAPPKEKSEEVQEDSYKVGVRCENCDAIGYVIVPKEQNCREIINQLTCPNCKVQFRCRHSVCEYSKVVGNFERKPDDGKEPETSL